jgi:hypothetical protein
VWPDALDKLNIDETIDEYASRAGTPPKLIRTEEEVEEIRDAAGSAAEHGKDDRCRSSGKGWSPAAALMAPAHCLLLEDGCERDLHSNSAARKPTSAANGCTIASFTEVYEGLDRCQATRTARNSRTPTAGMRNSDAAVKRAME